MKKTIPFTKYALIIVGVYLAAAVVACSKNDSNPPPPAAPAAPAPTNPTSGIPQCPMGYQLQTNICYNPLTGQQISPLNYQSNGIEYIAASYGYQNLTITNNSIYQDVLKNAMGVCEPSNVKNWSLFTFGSDPLKCSSWTSLPASIVIQDLSNNKLRMVMAVWGQPVGFNLINAQFSWNAYYHYVFNPMNLDMTNNLINNSAGMEAWGYGPRGSYAFNSLFKLRVASGKLGDPSLNFELLFKDQAFANGTLNRCQTKGCMNW